MRNKPNQCIKRQKLSAPKNKEVPRNSELLSSTSCLRILVPNPTRELTAVKPTTFELYLGHFSILFDIAGTVLRYA